MSDFGTTAEPIGNTRGRKGALAPKKRAGIGAQPLDGTNNRTRQDHLMHSFRNTAESPSIHVNNRTGVPPLRTKKRS